MNHIYLYINVLSTISFFNNSAKDTGGAIYVKERPYFAADLADLPSCFYQINSIFESSALKLIFDNNLATNGGDDFYGASLYGRSCRQLHSVHKLLKNTIDKIFLFQHKSLSSVTSDPTRVCLCNDQGTPQCANMEYIYRELPPCYPGEVFIVPAVVVGYDFKTVPGIVLSELVVNNVNSSIGQNQRVQEIKNHRECTKLNFSIESQITDTKHRVQLNVGQKINVG